MTAFPAQFHDPLQKQGKDRAFSTVRQSSSSIFASDSSEKSYRTNCIQRVAAATNSGRTLFLFFIFLMNNIFEYSPMQLFLCCKIVFASHKFHLHNGNKFYNSETAETCFLLPRQYPFTFRESINLGKTPLSKAHDKNAEK